ncbi:MAG TPA: cytochrome P450 [Xanthobacteraceae bacterium]|nr:cytochrome P450 [Xanthobacteraceae bacterium]
MTEVAATPQTAHQTVRDAAARARITPRFGLLEFLRRVREDQLSILTEDLFGQDIAYSRILFLHSFIINKPEYIEHVLLGNQRNYRKSDFLRRILGPLLGQGLLISEGEFWRRQRRIAAPAFHARRVAEFITAMTACTEARLDRWRSRGAPFDMANEMYELTLEIVARTMFSTNISGDMASLRRLTDVVVALRPSLLDLLGFPQWLPRPQAAAYRRAIAEFEALVARLLAERRADGRDRGDLLSMLLAARDPETGEGMSDRQLRDEILTILLAGHETVANALSWTWYLLAQNPEAEARLHEELARVLGGRPPRFAELAELKWTGMVIDEAMRLYPPAHSIGRTALGEDHIGGLRVPPGANLTISIYLTHRNPNLWPDPERFDPTRFAPEALAARHRFAYLPFGGGPRICIGNSLAIAEAKAILATIAQHYRVRLAAGRPVEPIGLVTLRPKNGVWVTLEPRSDAAATVRRC